MTEPEIYAVLQTLFHDIFDDESIVLTPATSAKDIAEWDSFNHVNIIVGTETKFKIKFTTSEIGGLKNVGDFVRLIEKKLA